MMNDVYDIKTGKKLETISYGNNRQKKYHHAQAHNKYMYVDTGRHKITKTSFNPTVIEGGNVRLDKTPSTELKKPKSIFEYVMDENFDGKNRLSILGQGGVYEEE